MYELQDVVFGRIITDVLRRDDVTDMMIWDDEIWVTDIHKGHFRYDLSDYQPAEIEEMKQTVIRLPRQIAMRMKMSFNESDPILDGEGLFAGIGQLRFNAIHENLTANSKIALAIRKSIHRLRINADIMLETGYADQSFLNLMAVLVDCGCNIIIAGQTGSGKTELLRYLARFIRTNQAVITIEDTLESYLKDLYPQSNVLALKSSSTVNIGALLRPCLRQNPDWICVSETRGREVIYLLEAVSTGHCLLSTVHTDSAVNIPLRMLEMSGIEGENRAMLYQQIFNHIDIGIYISYRNDQQGSHRRIGQVCEFYLDANLQPVCHCLCLYDFKTGCWSHQPLASPKIFRKIYEKETDTARIKGEYV